MLGWCDRKRQRNDRAMTPLEEQVIELIRALPEEATIDDIMAELYFKGQVDSVLGELDEGMAVAHEEVERRLARWLRE